MSSIDGYRLLCRTSEQGFGGSCIDERKTDTRADELVSIDSATILDRWLTALDAPVGSKHPEREIALPALLPDVSLAYRRRFCRLYLTLRGTKRTEQPGGVRLREERPNSYLDELVGLIDGCTLDDGSVYRSGRNVVVRPDAVEFLQQGSHGKRANKEDLLRELWRLRRERGSVPSRRYVESEGQFSHAVYYDHLGSFSEAVRVAGITPVSESWSSDTRE